MPDHFDVKLTWTGDKKGFQGRPYTMLFEKQPIPVSISRIKECLNTSPFSSSTRGVLLKNQDYLCTLSTDFPIHLASDEQGETFFLSSNENSEILAQGRFLHRLRRSDNIHCTTLTIRRKDREKLNQHKGKVIWLTGLSGSGKTTLANALEMRLHEMAYHTYLLDGDHLRHGLNADLGFTEADRIENIRRITEVAKLMLDAGLIVIAAFIAPFRKERLMAREIIGKENFIGVYVNTPFEICEKRDAKGLYKKAREGNLPNLSGIGSPYEEPKEPDIVVNGKDEKDLRNAVNILFERLLKSCNLS